MTTQDTRTEARDRPGQDPHRSLHSQTGTPGGTALKAPPKIAGKLAGLLPPATRWKLFFGARCPLHPSRRWHWP